ncbi:MAG TPA: ABC transporter ATP-binding protein [Candidatus Binataceae bacterium]|nr:ABC transporter ATP-binding protein [Candidatus Binataceae bacterium]
MKVSLGGFLSDLREASGRHLWWTVALSILCSLSEGAGLALIVPTLAVAGFNFGSQGGADRYATLIRTSFAHLGLKPNLLTLLAILIAVIGARAILDRSRDLSLWTVQQHFEDVLRRRLYRAIANANWLFITRSRFADFSHALTAEITRVGEAVLFILTLASDTALAVIYLSAALVLSTATTLTVIAAASFLAFLLRRKTQRVQCHGAELARVTNQLYAAAGDHLQGLKTARTYDAPERNFELFANLSRSIAGANLAAVREQAAATLWFQLGAVLLMLPILYLALRVFTLAPATLLILLLIFVRVMPRFQMSHRNYQNLFKALPSYLNVISLEQRCRAAEEPPIQTCDAPPFEREIRLHRVSFRYQPDAPPALSNLDLAVPAGHITAIVGPSGAGKSTIIDLVMGLLVADSGAITFDGVPLLPGAAHAWRRRIGYVAQETALFHLSIRDNLVWARPNATADEIWEALRIAAADRFVRALPHGVDTVVGDRGLMLSQGERQRVALARALLRRPSLLILDEATNSMDYATEARVLEAIAQMRGPLTVLTVAHRLSAIRSADLIYVIEEGRIVESGRFEDLNKRENGRFRALCNAHRLEV